MGNRMADEISRLITVPAFLQHYGYATGRNRRIPCPLHAGKDANFAYTNEVFHCWSCGAKGNVIQLAMQLFGINFGQALLKFNADFGLGLTVRKPTYRERQAMAEGTRVDRAYRQWQEMQHSRYLAVAAAHAALCRQHVQNPEDGQLKAYLSKLEWWLELNY